MELIMDLVSHLQENWAVLLFVGVVWLSLDRRITAIDKRLAEHEAACEVRNKE